MLDFDSNNLDDANAFDLINGWLGHYVQSVAARIAYHWPASYHNGAASFSFTDGHVEPRQWKDKRIMPPLRKGTPWLYAEVQHMPHSPDIRWMQERATRRRCGSDATESL